MSIKKTLEDLRQQALAAGRNLESLRSKAMLLEVQLAGISAATELALRELGETVNVLQAVKFPDLPEIPAVLIKPPPLRLVAASGQQSKKDLEDNHDEFVALADLAFDRIFEP